MKILVFADIHGSISAMETAVNIFQRERPDKVVFCGDLFGGWMASEKQVAQLAQGMDAVLYFVRGNNDCPVYDSLIDGGFEDNAVLYHFGRTLYFTHGDRYNAFRVPPILTDGDVLVYGHTHVSHLTKRDGLFVLNVGSLARPRDGQACYLVLEDGGATLKKPNGDSLYFLPWA